MRAEDLPAGWTTLRTYAPDMNHCYNGHPFKSEADCVLPDGWDHFLCRRCVEKLASIAPPPANVPVFTQFAFLPDGSAYWAPLGTPRPSPDGAWPLGWLRVNAANLKLIIAAAERAEAGT